MLQIDRDAWKGDVERRVQRSPGSSFDLTPMLLCLVSTLFLRCELVELYFFHLSNSLQLFNCCVEFFSLKASDYFFNVFASLKLSVLFMVL